MNNKDGKLLNQFGINLNCNFNNKDIKEIEKFNCMNELLKSNLLLWKIVFHQILLRKSNQRKKRKSKINSTSSENNDNSTKERSLKQKKKKK